MSLNSKALKIQKLFKPIISKSSGNIEDRIRYYLLIKKFLNIKENKNKCIGFYKLNKDGKPIFRIGNNIILKNEFEDDTYMCSFRDKNQKFFKYTCKLQIFNTESKKDLEIQQQLTKAIVKCHHFPILYNYTICKSNNSSFKSLYDFINKYVYKFKENSDSFIKSNSRSVNNPNKELPNVVIKALENKKDLLINFNEYYDGNLKDFIDKNSKNINIIYNALTQVYLSLMFFYQETGRYHGNSSDTNFHYHKIQKGGCFHYKIFEKDYYLENLGYLWTINDFSYSEPVEKNINELYIVHDFDVLIETFLPLDDKKIKEIYLNYIKNITKYDVQSRNLLIMNIINQFEKNNFLLREKPKKIINKLPYILFKDFNALLNSKALKIQKFFINRNSMNIEDRIKYYLSIKKFLNINENKNKCLKLYKIINGKITYRIGNNIILKDKIGSASEYGIVYLTSFRDKNKKLFKYACKITLIYDDGTMDDLEIQKKLTKAITKCPHFPILYGYYICKNKNNNSDSYVKSNSKDLSIKEYVKLNPEIALKAKKNTYGNMYNLIFPNDDISSFKDENDLYPKLILDGIKDDFDYLITFNELANGDLFNILENKNIESYVIINAFTQICFSLMFFYQETGKYHCDTHAGNFLYHKIKNEGFFHYKLFGEDYYLENVGYLWTIIDFDYSVDITKYKKDEPKKTFEFIFIIKEIMNEIKNNNNHKIIIKILNEIYEKLLKDTTDYSINTLNKIMMNLVNEFVIRKFLIPKKKIPSDAHVINKSPYILNIIK